MFQIFEDLKIQIYQTFLPPPPRPHQFMKLLQYNICEVLKRQHNCLQSLIMNLMSSGWLGQDGPARAMLLLRVLLLLILCKLKELRKNGRWSILGSVNQFNTHAWTNYWEGGGGTWKPGKGISISIKLPIWLGGGRGSLWGRTHACHRRLNAELSNKAFTDKTPLRALKMQCLNP